MSSSNSVLVIGTFDLLHHGHIDFLRTAATMGDLTVGVNSDEFASSFKEPPIMTEEERIYAISQLGYPAVINHSAGRELIEQIEPDVLATGTDWARRDYLTQIDVTQDWLDEHLITLAYIPRVTWRPISSSEIKRRVREA